MLAVSCLRAPILAAAASSVESQTTVSVPDSRRAFSYSRASPSLRWPDLQLEDPDKTLDWITLAKEADAQRVLYDAHQPLDDAHHAHNDGIGAPTDGHDHHPIDPPRSTITGFTPPLNPYIAAHGRSHRSIAAQSSFVTDLIEPKARSLRPNGRLIRLSKLALKRAKDWRERVQRLSTAICSLGAKDSVADLLKEWHEQLAPTDMCFVLKRVGDIDWQRALELYEWYNLRHWYEPNARMLAGMLSILSRVHQVSLAKEIFDRAELGVGNCVQVYNAMMSVYARQGYCDKVQGLLTLMKQKGCDPDLITYNTVINARCKAGLIPGMAVQLLKEMKKDQLTPDVITYNTLISACASRNDCAEAEKIFHTMKVYRCEPDLWTYNALISLYGRSSGKEDIAIEYFDVIKKKGLVPDAVTYNSVLYAFAKSGRVDDVDKVRMQMTEAGCSADEITYNTMISMYGKLGLHEKALSLYHEMRNEDCHPDAVTFTVLIDALGKAGLVNEAENIFQEMADSEVRPTLQAFSAMIYAYAKVGKYAAAQSTYDCMLQTGIVPDNLAFRLMLDVLQKASLPQKGMALYQRAVKRSFVPELGIYGTLLQWFTQKGLSKEVDIVSNDLICSGFTCAEVCDTFLNADLPERAAQLLESAHAQGSSVSEQLLLDVLRSFGVLAKYHEAQLFVSSLSSLAPHLGPLMHEALIAMLAKAKQVVAVKDEIEKVRTCAKPLSLDTYRILVTLFYDAEMLDQVMLVSSEMQSFGIELDEVCEKCVTSAYGKLNAVDSGNRPVNSLTLGGNTNLTLDSFISRIEAFGKQHLWERAESTFRELQEAGHRPSLRAWNTLISAFAICGEYENARFALAEMIADGKMPTACTCNAMLQAVINAGRPRDICNVLQEMRQYGVSPGKNIFLAILDSSANEGKVQVAKAAFQELKGAGYLPNMQVYKSLILLFARVRLVRDAENMIKEMGSDGFSPDVTIYNSMITLYGKMGYYRKGAEVFTGMQAAGCSPDSYTFNSLIWLYSKCLKIQEALAIVRQMEKAGFVPDVESYTALISACGRLRMQEAAEVLFKDAYESGCKLNYKVFHAMMNVYRNVGQPEQVKIILNKMSTANIAPTLGTFHVLMDSYGKGGDPKQAEAVLDAMQEAGFSPGPLQYAGVVNAYLRNNDNEQAIGKLLGLKNEGFEPDYMIWTAVVGAASHCKESSEAVRLLSALADVGFSLPLRLLKEKNLALVAEFDQILQGLEGFGLEAGLGLVNVLLDLLWAFQMRATAARLFTVAIQRKLYSSTMARVQVKDWCADLRRLSAGAALVALTLWLDQMQDAALQGFPESPKFVTLVTGCNQSARNKISVEQTVKVHLWSMGSPFLKSESRTGLFEAKGYSLRHWLKDSPHCMDMKLRNFSVLPEMNSMQVHGGAFMPARLVSGLQQIEESMGDLRPKKFRRLIHLTEMKRNQVIFAELKAREEMGRKGRRVNLKGKRKAKLRKRLHRIQPVK